MGRYAGDWGGWYCYAHVPSGFTITDRIKKAEPPTCNCSELDDDLLEEGNSCYNYYKYQKDNPEGWNS